MTQVGPSPLLDLEEKKLVSATLSFDLRPGIGHNSFIYFLHVLQVKKFVDLLDLHNAFENATWENVIIGASGEMRDANTQFVGNPALAEMLVEYVTNLIKAHCIGKPQNLHTPLKFPNPPKLSQNIHNPAFFYSN